MTPKKVCLDNSTFESCYLGNFAFNGEKITWCLGLPTIDGKTALGASSPAKPALHMPEPLSTTRAAESSSHILPMFCAQIQSLVLKSRVWCSNPEFSPQILELTLPSGSVD